MSSKKYCEATETDTAGVVFLIVLIGKPPRPRDMRMLRAVFLMARPPLLAVMQGGDYRLTSIWRLMKNPSPSLRYFFSEAVQLTMTVIGAASVSTGSWTRKR